MPKIYDKPFLTFDEQIELMRSRGIDVENDIYTHEKLSSISYYSLINGYKNTLLKNPNSEEFIDGTTFNMIYRLFLFDSLLSNTLLKYILHVERSLKTKIAYRIAEKYGVDSSNYLNPSNYFTRDNRLVNRVLKHLNDKCTSPMRNTTSYYYANHKNHLPPWILVNDISFNRAIDWYSILKSDDKSYIANKMILQNSANMSTDERKEFLIKSLRLLLDYRNSLAHGNKVFAPHIHSILPKNPLMKLVQNDMVLKESEYNMGFGQKDLLAATLSLMLLINNPDILTFCVKDFAKIFGEFAKQEYIGRSSYELLGISPMLGDRLAVLLVERMNNSDIGLWYDSKELGLE